jgi:hypothetical protein
VLYILEYIYLVTMALNKIGTELLGLFWTLSIVLYVEDKKILQRFGDWICLRNVVVFFVFHIQDDG